MKLLLDSHLLLWAAGQPERLSPIATTMIEDPANELYFSAASLWEITIKATLGREEFRVEPRLFRRGLLDNDYAELSITGEHAIETASLPPLHRDPFDRMLIAQAMREGMLLLTSDPLVGAYPGPVRLV